MDEAIAAHECRICHATSMWRRRSFLRALAVGPALAICPAQSRSTGPVPPYEPWKAGMLDIHHISTGRGNCTLVICPDGTSMMVDAGAWHVQPAWMLPQRPDGSRRPGEWIGRYARRHLHSTGREEIDYFILTHFHADHMGGLSPDSPLALSGAYRLTGVADVAEVLPICRFIDRAYPDYNYPSSLDDPDQKNYVQFIREQARRGATVERIRVGTDQQIRLVRDAHSYQNFSIRNLAANGEVWTGVADSTRHYFPDLNDLKRQDYPSENMCCLALRLSLGKFNYYTGGDLPCDDDYGKSPWRNIETPVARAAGPVDVAVADHHAYYDGCGPDFIAALRPRAFVIFGVGPADPVERTLVNMLNTRLYPGERDIFATGVKAENKIANRTTARLKSDDGHIVVRVAPDAGSFRIVILDNADERDHVLAQFGPYQ